MFILMLFNGFGGGDVKMMFAPEDFAGEGIVVKRGKKNFKRIVK